MERQKATMELYSRSGEPNEWLLADVVADADLNRFIHVLPVGDRVTSPEFPLGARLSTYDAIFSWNKYIPIITRISEITSVCSVC